MKQFLKPIITCYLLILAFGGISFANSLSDVDGVDFNCYMNKMYKTVQQNWQPPIQEGSGQVVVSYKIKKDGTIIEPKVVSSTNEKLNNFALEAIKKSSPLQPLPKDCNKKLIEVSFTFNYNLE